MATVSINVCIPVILEAASVLAVLVPHETQLACRVRQGFVLSATAQKRLIRLRFLRCNSNYWGTKTAISHAAVPLVVLLLREINRYL